MNGYAPTADATILPTPDIQRLLPNPSRAVAGEILNTAEAHYHLATHLARFVQTGGLWQDFRRAIWGFQTFSCPIHN